jgi:hypothetical protein
LKIHEKTRGVQSAEAIGICVIWRDRWKNPTIWRARLAVGHETLGYVKECSGRYAEAAAELQLAAKVRETLLPKGLAELLRSLEHRTDLLELLRRKGNAARMRERIATLTLQLEGKFAVGAGLVSRLPTSI